jgi:hypothetical protein
MRAALLSYSNEIGNHPPSSQTFCLVCFPPLQRSGCKTMPGDKWGKATNGTTSNISNFR